ncbi:MAG TPA: ArgR family transcriptional regulator [Acidobacteriaceae bacterium]|jgi:transcriptional regulator of arginine metabolism
MSTNAIYTGKLKEIRHGAIRELLSKRSVQNQALLRQKLAGRGIRVAQATLSRDIRELKLVKSASGYELPETYRQAEDETHPKLENVVQHFAVRVRRAENLLIVQTTTGGAQPVAAAIDQEESKIVVGTVAGDDTVLIVCPDHDRAAKLQAKLEAYIG